MIRATFTDCQFWRWTPDGKKHFQCPNDAAMRSEIPGRITRESCAECHYRRLKETYR